VRVKGKITTWNDERGFGFITPLGAGKRVFVHINAFRNRSRRPEIDQVVTYALSSDRQGRPCASNATLAGDRLPQNAGHRSGLWPVVGAGLFLLFVALAVFTSHVSPLIFAVYITASLLSFATYAFDKSAAKKGAWRTRESTLHLLSLAGGWPGALVAQQTLRHKSKKRSFRTVFRATVALNCGAFVWLLTPTGSATLNSLIAFVV
jgi:uncharacterized membrane protein YsdA (DUF1294 family)/cold shock CspA family protein